LNLHASFSHSAPLENVLVAGANGTLGAFHHRSAVSREHGTDQTVLGSSDSTRRRLDALPEFAVVDRSDKISFQL
jgi:hypothetical protein